MTKLTNKKINDINDTIEKINKFILETNITSLKISKEQEIQRLEIKKEKLMKKKGVSNE